MKLISFTDFDEPFYRPLKWLIPCAFILRCIILPQSQLLTARLCVHIYLNGLNSSCLFFERFHVLVPRPWSFTVPSVKILGFEWLFDLSLCYHLAIWWNFHCSLEDLERLDRHQCYLAIQHPCNHKKGAGEEVCLTNFYFWVNRHYYRLFSEVLLSKSLEHQASMKIIMSTKTSSPWALWIPIFA